MRRSALISSAVGLAVGAAFLTGSAVAGGGSSNDGTGGGFGAAAIGGAAAPNAVVAAFVQAGGAVVRSKGVTAVTHPGVGVYCIDPAPAMNVNARIPTLSVDWSTSLGDALMAHWRSAGVGCPSGWFSVLTFDGEDGTFDLSDGVSFTFLVP